jgi:cytidylate kinase
MAIITISRGTFSGGQSLAECVAAKLGYRCIPRVVSYEAAKKYGISDEDLTRAISETPGLLDRWSSERTRYITCLRAALINEVKNNDVVYHGLAGHLLLQGVPSVFRVRVIADMESRIQAAMDRGLVTRNDAIQFIKAVDEKRSRWTHFLYHVDWTDPSLYDLVINLHHFGIQSAAELVATTASSSRYAITPEAQAIMNDMVLGSHVRALIAADKTISDRNIQIRAENGVVTVFGTADSIIEADRIRRIISNVPGVERINSMMRVLVPVLAVR